MPKYLIQACYTLEGARGVMKDGGTGRRTAVEEMLKSVDGKLEACYFAFGETDVFVIVDVPNNVSAAAVALTVNASGMAQIKTTVLLTPEEVDQVTKKTV